jgi:predicted lactoylglutathione lyase
MKRDSSKTQDDISHLSIPAKDIAFSSQFHKNILQNKNKHFHDSFRWHMEILHLLLGLHFASGWKYGSVRRVRSVERHQNKNIIISITLSI